MTLMRGRWRSEFGGALVELAVALPVLIIVFAGTVDFARVFYTAMNLTNAARAGAQYGGHNPAQSGDIATMLTTATSATNLPGITAVASRTCQCANDTGTFSPTTTPNDCLSPETVSCPGRHVVITVTVTTSTTFNTIMTFGIPGFMRSLSLSRSATMRIYQQP